MPYPANGPDLGNPRLKLHVDLEGEGPGFTVHHDFITSVFFHFEVFGDEGGDVLGGGLARLFTGFRDFLMQVDRDLGTQVSSFWHGVILLSFDRDPSILERHGECYYQHHQGMADKPSITTNVNSGGAGTSPFRSPSSFCRFSLNRRIGNEFLLARDDAKLRA